MEAIAARETTRKGKRNGGSCGGDEDYRVDEAQAEREKLLEEPMIDDVAIKVAEEKIELALAKKEKTRVGKSKGGIKAFSPTLLNFLKMIPCLDSHWKLLL